MESKSEELDSQLKSRLSQLKTESDILDRIVYKGKNQHRRCLYFQYLMKVRRDLRLLQSAGLEDILRFLFQVIGGKKPTQKLHFLERLKNKGNHNGKHNFHERLLGVARLLSQMVEPILKASTQISSLLARSFFMGFALMVLAVLARLRVLLQQILLDVVSVYNMLSALSQTEQSIKLTQEGLGVFREYYPPNEAFLTLECVWEVDKFSLLERTNHTKRKDRDADLRGGLEISPETPIAKYQNIQAIYMDDENKCEEITVEHSTEDHAPSDNEQKSTNKAQNSIKIGDGPVNKNAVDGGDIANEQFSDEQDLIPSPIPEPSTPRTESRSKVAFVSVRKSALSSKTKRSSPHKKAGIERPASCAEESPFSSLLFAGIMKDSIF